MLPNLHLLFPVLYRAQLGILWVESMHCEDFMYMRISL